MKHCIVEDSSFVVATMDNNDKFHKDAIYVFKELLKNKDKIQIVIPPLVVYECLATLIKKGVDFEEAKNKIWKFIHIKEIMVVNLSELAVFKHCRRFLDSGNEFLKTNDFIIANTAMDFEAQILTFDKGMRDRISNFYDKIYYCSPIDSEDETLKFLEDLSHSVVVPEREEELV